MKPFFNKCNSEGTDETAATHHLVRHEVTVCAPYPTETSNLAQLDIQALILRLVTAHLEYPMPEEMTFQDEHYTLHARE